MQVGHNCIMMGAPGVGKTMMAERVKTILPDMTFNEAIEVMGLYSIMGKLPNNLNGIFRKRPFRNPHYTISPISLIGGGKIPKPGEISLAHNGVLFLDELPEFKKSALEALRVPLEERNLYINRISGSVKFPCNFMLIASMNSCPCGYYGSKKKKCKCTEIQIKKYRSRISGPVLDRIDIQINVPDVDYEDFKIEKNESSKDIRKRVNFARNKQIERYKEYNIYSNSGLTIKLINEFCKINQSSQEILRKYFEKLKLNGRTYFKILKVARTIADLEDSDNINENHVLEAIQLSRF